MKRFLVFLVLLTACQSTPAPEPEKLQVLTSFYPIEFIAKTIAGERADVSSLVPAGVEPHDYEPSAAQFAEMEEADLLLAQGAGFEPWLHDIEGNLEQAGVKLMELNDSVSLLSALEEDEHQGEHEDEHEDEHGEFDPHTWLDPVLVVEMAATVRDALTELDPQGASVYAANAEELIASLDGLNEEFETGLSACAHKDFVSAHNAFQYLAQRYGLTAHGIAGFSPHDEPSAQALVELKEEMEALQLSHLYFEEGASTDVAEVLVNELGVSPLVLSTVEFLTPEQIAEGKTYFSLMRENLIQLRTGLKCN